MVGFQELEDPQYYRMLSLSGWDAYPGPTLDRGSIRNSLAWDPDVWDLVEAQSAGIPYFGGQIIRRPVVKLQNRESGREVWFFNTHNPASTPNHGNNARWRAAAIGIEIALANELGADGTPVVFTGDYNDRDAAFCPLVGGTDLEAANGGSYDGGCAPPDRMDVDWVFGSGIEWSDFSSISAGVVGRVSTTRSSTRRRTCPRSRSPGCRPPSLLRRPSHRRLTSRPPRGPGINRWSRRSCHDRLETSPPGSAAREVSRRSWHDLLDQRGRPRGQAGPRSGPPSRSSSPSARACRGSPAAAWSARRWATVRSSAGRVTP